MKGPIFNNLLKGQIYRKFTGSIFHRTISIYCLQSSTQVFKNYIKHPLYSDTVEGPEDMNIRLYCPHGCDSVIENLTTERFPQRNDV